VLYRLAGKHGYVVWWILNGQRDGFVFGQARNKVGIGGISPTYPMARLLVLPHLTGLQSTEYVFLGGRSTGSAVGTSWHNGHGTIQVLLSSTKRWDNTIVCSSTSCRGDKIGGGTIAATCYLSVSSCTVERKVVLWQFTAGRLLLIILCYD
jgi:hypothetical protein